MAQSSFYNADEQYDLDPATGQYVKKSTQTPTVWDREMLGGSGSDAGAAPANDQAYWQGQIDPALLKAGGGFQANDVENINKYGLDPFVSELQKRRGSQQGGGQQGPQYQTPTQQWNAQPAQPQMSDPIYKLLMDRATQGTAINRNDPTVRQQVDPVVAQQERASRNYLDQVAEQSGPLANIQGERRLASERSGQAAGALESEVIGREIAARRDEIQQSLSLYGQLMSNEQRLALERELGYLNDNARTADRDLSKQGMLQSNDQFLRELALREWMAGDQSAQGWAGFGG